MTVIIPEALKYASIPFVAAIVGWATNWVAIKMTFLPLKFFGIKRLYLGWQGIIPSKAVKMAGTFVDSTMYRLGTLAEVFEQMDPQIIGARIIEYVEPRMDEYTDEIMLENHAVLWENLPPKVKNEIYFRVRSEIGPLVEKLMVDITENLDELVDMKEMITTQLVADKALLNRLFQDSGEEEFDFIIKSGFYFGFLLGLVQLVAFYFLPVWWILPLFGLMVGYATNWLALNIVFRPLEPTKVGPWTVQGLFLKRQAEVAVIWCRLVTREILTMRRLISHMLTGPRASRMRSLIYKHIKPLVDQAVGLNRPTAQVAVGVQGFAGLKAAVGRKAVEVSLRPFNDSVLSEERSLVVERLLRERMLDMRPDEFQDLLRPPFQEDEMKLILLGAALGLAAGFAQLIFVFGGL